MSTLQVLLSVVCLASPTDPSVADVWSTFVEQASADHGEFGQRAAAFLAENRPEADADLPLDLLTENLDYALRARAEFAWAGAVPEDVFLNDVLPYASLDETREAWRPKFYRLGKELVAECTTASEAAQALNQKLFNEIGVHYNTGRKRPNQSPSESIAQGRATCTGLSILLVDACRAVGVPARITGTALWANKRGNHTWVEIWDGEWKFAGADEYDSKGLNRGWFVKDASHAKSDSWMQSIWSTSWRSTEDSFPMVWDIESRAVPGVNVTHRYTGSAEPAATSMAVWNLRVRATPNGERIAAKVSLLDSDGMAIQTVTTRAGRSDLNDMPDIRVAPGQAHVLSVTYAEELRTLVLTAGEAGSVTQELIWSELPAASPAMALTEAWIQSDPKGEAPSLDLSKSEAQAAVKQLTEQRAHSLREERQAEHEAKTVVAAGVTMKFDRRIFADAPFGERSLWISMHGGGGAPAEVNDQQWRNQIGLYEPAEGYYVAPRAPTNAWNLWHQGHIDALFDRLIENHILFDGIDPNRVYLMGYSAGGDGVYQLAPRMADRFAAASMMAGHPNNASPLGLRNLPFAIFMGGNDSAYDRNAVAAQWGERLDELAAEHPGAYPHRVDIFEGLGHWMDRRDGVAVPWMAEHSRGPWPTDLIWNQASRTHDRFAWLAVPLESARAGQLIQAGVADNTISIVADEVPNLTLRLSDELVDLDQNVVVIWNGVTVHDARVPRRLSAIIESLAQRFDPATVATALLPIKRPAAQGN